MNLRPEDWSRVKNLFDRARAQAPELRGAFLNEVGTGNEALRREVESLLASSEEDDAFLETPAARVLDALRPIGLLEKRRLGPYELSACIGAGGMGEVYRARDTRLNRTVAIKVLPAHLAADPHARERFEREARAVAALNHPHICTLHDVGNQEGFDFLVMEFLEGETLAARLARGALPMANALQVAIQIVLALDTAHRAGIVHRDLKPGNVFLVLSGGASALPTAKLLDFGLAKATRPAVATTSTAMTRSPAVTAAGLIVGTVQYMAPEQIEGKEVDGRTDIFAFGTVFFEMLTGKKAFEADSNAGLMAAILEREPPALSTLQPLTPPSLDRLVRTCLAKDPDDRWQTARDLLRELRWLADPTTVANLSGEEKTGAKRLRRALRGGRLLAAGLALVVPTAALTWWVDRTTARETPASAPVTRLTSDAGLTTDPALSPDGKLVVYASDRAGDDNLDLWVQQVDGGTPLRLTSDPADEYAPSFSPDGTRIVFRSDRDVGGVYTIPALGGEPRLIVKNGHQPRFSPDGSRLAYVTTGTSQGGIASGALSVVLSSGGTAQELVSEAGVSGAALPVWSPDGAFILFGAGKYRIEAWGIVRSDRAESVVLPLAGVVPSDRDESVILPLDGLRQAGLGDIMPRDWLPGNRILFEAKSGDSSHVFEIGLSPPSWVASAWRLDASPRRLTFGTAQDERPAVSSVALPAGGRRLAFASVARKENVWSFAVDTNQPSSAGTLTQLTQGTGSHIFPSVSTDGTKLAFISHVAYNDEVSLLDVKTGRTSVLSTTVSTKFRTHIRPDGSEVFYTARGTTNNEPERIYAVRVSEGAPEPICDKCRSWVWDWSPDRRWLLVFGPVKTAVLATLINIEANTSRVFLSRPNEDLYDFRWSPDGRWIVFKAETAGRSRTYVAAFSGDDGPAEATWIPLTDGSTWEGLHDWSPDGRWIYALSNRDGFRCLWAYPVDALTRRPAGSPIAVFHSHGARVSLRNANSVSQGLSVARDRVVFNQGEITGNIWLTEIRDPD